MNKKLKEFIGTAVYLRVHQSVVNEHGQQLCDIRGWGAIQHLFSSPDDAMKFQDELGEFIASAINSKVVNSQRWQYPTGGD